MLLTLTNKLLLFNRKTKKLIMILIDSVLIVFGLLSAYSIRLGYWIWPQAEIHYVIESWVILLSPLIAIPIFISFGLYRSIIRYIGFKSIWTIVQAVTLYAVIWGLITYMIKLPGIPRSAILINWMLAFIVIGGWRILARWYLVGDIEKKKKKKVIIYGAGSAGRQLSTTISTTSEFTLVGFVDDSELIQGHHINGVKVFPSSILFFSTKPSIIDDGKTFTPLM
jgi:FlaA1/EpsC-like NDP-sugar epimerase